MARACSICTHAARAEIDRALVAGEASNRRIAARYNTSERAMRDHKTNHLAARMRKASERRDDADLRTAIDVVTQLRAINSAALTILATARASGDGDLALKAIDRIQKQIELQAKLIGDLQQEGTVNLSLSPEWLEIRAVIVSALSPHPAAAQAVAASLQAVEWGANHAGG